MSDCFSIRINTWDIPSLEKNVSEFFVQSNKFSDDEIKLIEDWNKKNLIDLSISRIPSNDIYLKGLLIKYGFYQAETSVLFHLSKATQPPKSFFSIKKPIDLTNDEKKLIIEIGGNNFHHSRFHEDPFIPKHKAYLRYKLWTHNLLEKNLIYGLTSKDRIIAFFSFSENMNDVDLTIAGIDDEHKGFGFFAFSSIICFLKSFKKDIIARVSVANIEMFNIYLHLGFKLKSTELDFHKDYTKRCFT